MNFEKLKLEDVLSFKDMVVKGYYFNNEEYVQNVEKAIYHWVDEHSRFSSYAVLNFNMNLLIKELQEVFSFKGDIYRGIDVESKDDIEEDSAILESFTSNWEIALSFTKFGEMCYGLDKCSPEYIQNTRFYVAVKRNVESFALDNLMALIRDNTLNDDITDLMNEFIGEEEKLSCGEYDEIIEFSFYDIKLISDCQELKSFSSWDKYKKYVLKPTL